MPRSFTFVCQLYCCSAKHSNKALRNNVQLLQNREYLQYGLRNGNHIDKIISDVSVIQCRPIGYT